MDAMDALLLSISKGDSLETINELEATKSLSLIGSAVSTGTFATELQLVSLFDALVPLSSFNCLKRCDSVAEDL
ncbi:hypothetical protein HDU99_003154, partial [Rhizoclosmatium hyalinum]